MGDNEVLYYLFLAMIVVGVLLFIASLVLVFVFKIPELIDELSGNKERRQIKRLKELNADSGALDSYSTKDVYQTISSGSVLVNKMMYEEQSKKNMGSDGSQELEAISKEIKSTAENLDTTGGSGDISGSVKTGNLNNGTEKESEENKTGYMETPINNSIVESGSELGDESEEKTGYIEHPLSLEESTNIPKDSKESEEFDESDPDEQPTGYIKWESPEDREQSTGFMDGQILMDEEVTGIISEVEGYISSKRIVQILEVQTSLTDY